MTDCERQLPPLIKNSILVNQSNQTQTVTLTCRHSNEFLLLSREGHHFRPSHKQIHTSQSWKTKVNIQNAFLECRGQTL